MNHGMRKCVVARVRREGDHWLPAAAGGARPNPPLIGLAGAVLLSFGLAGCGGGSSGGGVDAGTDPETDEASSPTDEGTFTAVVARMGLVEIGDSGPVHVDGIRFPAIGPEGHVVYQTTLRDPVDFDFLSGQQTFFMLAADGAEPVPYFSPYLELPGDPGYTLTGNPTAHGPAADGSIVALMTLEDEQEDTIEVAYRYHDGEYERLFDGENIPGLPEHHLDWNISSLPLIARNHAGEMALLMALRDEENSVTRVWFRGDDEGFEPVLEYGDSTGIEDDETGVEYRFEWPYVGTGYSRPVIDNEGGVSFYFNTRAEMPEEHEWDFKSLRALWTLDAGEDDPEVGIRTGHTFVDQGSGEQRTVGQFIGVTQVEYSANDHGERVLVHQWGDDDLTGLLLQTGDGIRSLAREGQAAPNVDQAGLTSGATFGMIDNAVLANNGHAAFHAAVEDKTGIWVFDGEETRPVAIEGMEAPDSDGAVFGRVGREKNPSHVGNPPLINNRGQVVFAAELESGADTFDSLWAHDPCHGLSLIAAEGRDVELEGLPSLVRWEDGAPVWEPAAGAERTIAGLEMPRFSRYPANGPNVGYPVQLNDRGEFVFVASLAGDFSVFAIEEGVTGVPDRQNALLRTRLAGCDADN